MESAIQKLHKYILVKDGDDEVNVKIFIIASVNVAAVTETCKTIEFGPKVREVGGGVAGKRSNP